MPSWHFLTKTPRGSNSLSKLVKKPRRLPGKNPNPVLWGPFSFRELMIRKNPKWGGRRGSGKSGNSQSVEKVTASKNWEWIHLAWNEIGKSAKNPGIWGFPCSFPSFFLFSLILSLPFPCFFHIFCLFFPLFPLFPLLFPLFFPCYFSLPFPLYLPLLSLSIFPFFSLLFFSVFPSFFPSFSPSLFNFFKPFFPFPLFLPFSFFLSSEFAGSRILKDKSRILKHKPKILKHKKRNFKAQIQNFKAQKNWIVKHKKQNCKAQKRNFQAIPTHSFCKSLSFIYIFLIFSKIFSSFSPEQTGAGLGQAGIVGGKKKKIREQLL